ncbi:MAG: ATP-binding cassette domain-containing protein [Nitrospinae bacterium]|nr:ATP-binding cassette domain-containing protein [Nitrospinota bacterium]
MITVDIRKKFASDGREFSLDVKMEVAQNAFVALYGKSGSGKTTLLRMIAGLLEPDDGVITVDGVAWHDKGESINLAPQKRGVGMVFQDYALFPNMTVFENIVYAAGKNNMDWVRRLVEAANLGSLQSRNPAELSGGEKQRVAVARALARKPGLLLLDEPMSALDVESRAGLQDELLAMHREFGLTTIMVTHELSEVFKMATDVFILEAGRVLRRGKPSGVYSDQNPAGQFRFAGEISAIEKQDVVYVVSVIVGNTIVKVMAAEEEISSFSVGDKVLLISKAFNPHIVKPGLELPFYNRN